MKCEDRFITSRSRNPRIVECSVYANSMWRENEFQIGFRVSHSWEQGKGSQELNVTMSAVEAIDFARNLLIKATSDLAEKVKANK